MDFRELRRIRKNQQNGRLEILAYIVSYRTYLATISLGFIGIIIAIAYGTISKGLSETQTKISLWQRRSEVLIEHNRVNDLVYASADLYDELVLFKDKKDGIGNYKIMLLSDRIDKLQKLIAIMRKMYDIGELIPNAELVSMFSICSNNLIQAKLYYTQQINRGLTTDTTENSTHSFDSLMYHTLIFTDSLGPHLSEGWAKYEAELASIDKRLAELNK